MSDTFARSHSPLRRFLIFHGYLLHGTGSNVYNANLARALVRLGHEVHLFCQEPHPEDIDFVDTVTECNGERLCVRWQRTPRFAGRCTVYRPAIGGLLPVYVYDHYEGFEVRTFPELTEAELECYLSANVAAVRAVVTAVKPECALANHMVMGPFILHRALGGAIPYVVKIHGSALEYTVRPYPRFLPYTKDGIVGAGAILVGSSHIAVHAISVLGEAEWTARIRLGPPGVDTEVFAPRDAEMNVAALSRLAQRLEKKPRTGFNHAAAERLDALSCSRLPSWKDLLAIQQTYDCTGIDEAAPRQLAMLNPRRERIVAFVGKLIVSKGLDLLLCAWPLVLACEPQAKLLVVGYGTYREGLEFLLRALERGDLVLVSEIARQGRALEGGAPDRLKYLDAFLKTLAGQERETYCRMAWSIRSSVIFTGRLGHDLLTDLLPAVEVFVSPSTFPEAFGMVVTEAAACGVCPVVAHHSGLAEVVSMLAAALPGEQRAQLSFAVDPGAVRSIADRVIAWLALPRSERRRLGLVLSEVVTRKLSWEHVAWGVLAACEGRLNELPTPDLKVLQAGR
jgi:glycosyltransferase involved in cell wall biosynthesis